MLYQSLSSLRTVLSIAYRLELAKRSLCLASCEHNQRRLKDSIVFGSSPRSRSTAFCSNGIRKTIKLKPSSFTLSLSLPELSDSFTPLAVMSFYIRRSDNLQNLLLGTAPIANSTPISNRNQRSLTQTPLRPEDTIADQGHLGAQRLFGNQGIVPNCRRACCFPVKGQLNQGRPQSRSQALSRPL